MNYARTAILLAGLTGLFMAVGYLIGGGSGALIALIIAAATNLFSYWNADKLVQIVAPHRRLAKRALKILVPPYDLTQVFIDEMTHQDDSDKRMRQERALD